MFKLQLKQMQIVLLMMACTLAGMVWMFIPHPALVLVLGLLSIIGLYVLKSPFIVTLMFVVFSFFRLHEVFPQLYTLRIPLLLSLASLGLLGWHIFISKRIKPYWTLELTIFTLFFILTTLGIVFASNRSLAMEYYIDVYIKIAIMTIAIAWLTRKPKDFNIASIILVLSGIGVSIVALYNKINGIGLVEGTRVTIGRELGSFLGDPNDLALVLLFPMGLAVSLVMEKGSHPILRVLGIFGVILLFSAIITTQSRGGLLGVMAVFGVFAYQYIKSKTLLFLIGAIAAIVLYVFSGISDRASGGSHEEGIDKSAQGRLYAWQAAFLMAVDNPVTGVGLNNFYANYFFYTMHWDGKPYAVHSTWFGVLAETGFVGLFLFTVMIMVLILSIKRSLEIIHSKAYVPIPIRVTAQGNLAGMAGIIVSGTFLTQGFTWPIYILMSFIVALSHWTKTSIKT